MKKEEIVKKHIAKYYHHKGRSVNNDDILPISRILPMMDEYATNKMIDENKSMLAMAELHMDERACVVLKQRIFELEKSLG
ncbi:MAG: hypothetical protein ABIP51_22605 [Bacteroidia bacterium]